MTRTVLCLNTGSSSVKFQLFHESGADALTLVLKGQFDGIGGAPRLVAEDAARRGLTDESFSAQDVPDVAAALPLIAGFLKKHLDGDLPSLIGHRLVFGGTRYSEPVLIDDESLAYLRSVVPLMPLHLPPELASIEAIRAQMPDLPQVGVFDTGFHRGQDALRQRLPVPESLHNAGVQSYGFHGISYEYIAEKLREIDPALAAGKVLVAHLGSGCSMCAMVDGRSVECSFSFSALGGVMMGTRPGRLDPGVLLYLSKEGGMTPDQIEHMLYRDCGLKGVSGISNDVRELLSSDAPSAKLALDMFCHSAAGMAALLSTGMGGLDGLVFTAGVGEHAAAVRADIGARLGWLGVSIDAAANEKGGPRISAQGSAVTCYVIPTNEELMIARHALAVVGRMA